jgi:hypothetical protein
MSTTTSLLGRRQPAARPRGQPAPSYARGGALKAKRSGGGVEAGPRHRPGAARTGEGWWVRGGRQASGLGSAPQTQRQGRAIRGRAAHRARTRAAAGNSPARPTSLFSPQSARGEPRHVGCSAPSTTSARSPALFRGFSYKNFAGLGRSRV